MQTVNLSVAPFCFHSAAWRSKVSQLIAAQISGAHSHGD